MITVVTVHGTGAYPSEQGKKKSWWEDGSDFHNVLKNEFDDVEFIPFSWGRKHVGGDNKDTVRTKEGTRLYELLADRLKDREKIVIVTHSHGGNVAANAIETAATFGSRLPNLFGVVNCGTPLMLERRKHRFRLHPSTMLTRFLLIWFLVAFLALSNAGIIAYSLIDVLPAIASAIALWTIFFNFRGVFHRSRMDLRAMHLNGVPGVKILKKLKIIRDYPKNYVSCFNEMFSRNCFVYAPYDDVISMLSTAVRSPVELFSTPTKSETKNMPLENTRIDFNLPRYYLSTLITALISISVFISFALYARFGFDNAVTRALRNLFYNAYNWIAPETVYNDSFDSILVVGLLTFGFLLVTILVSNLLSIPVGRMLDARLSASIRRFLLGNDAVAYEIYGVYDPFDPFPEERGKTRPTPSEITFQRHNKVSWDNIFKTNSQISPKLKEIAEQIAEEKNRYIGPRKDSAFFFQFRLQDILPEKRDGSIYVLSAFSLLTSKLNYRLEHNDFYEQNSYRDLIVSAIKAATSPDQPSTDGTTYDKAFGVERSDMAVTIAASAKDYAGPAIFTYR